MTASSNFQKYQTTNPLMRGVIRRFVDRVVDTAIQLAPRRIVDLGCGEGIVAQALVSRLPDVEYYGLDASSEAIEVARGLNPELEFAVGDLLDAPGRPGWADLAICLEVLEHLEDPDAGLARVLQWTRRDAVVSVPWEPFFRLGNLLRGRHVRVWGNHPEHLQQFDRRSFGELLSHQGRSVDVRPCFPWLIGHVRVIG